MISSILDPTYPRRIDMELERPDDAYHAEWEAFVSWYLQEGCEHMIAAMQDLWKNREGYGFRLAAWKGTVGGLPLSRYSPEHIEQTRLYWRERAKLLAAHEQKIGDLRRAIFKKEGD